MTVVSEQLALAPRADQTSTARRARVALAVVAFVVPLLYAAHTHHVWEDYLITFRHAQNWVLGRGLTYNPPERVHGFTSPIGVLLPAVFYRLTGAGDSYLPALWVFRFVSAAVFAAAVLCFARVVDAHDGAGKRRGWALLLPLLLLLDAKSVGFAANGQETAFMLLFLGVAVDCLTRDSGRRRVLPLAVAIAGLQWTRPDAFLFAGAVGFAAVCFAARGQRRDVAIRLSKAIAIAVVLYLPWIVFTWAYYGSPVPHTIRAKSSFLSSAGDLTNLYAGLRAPLLDLPNRMAAALMPIYASMGTWPAWADVVAKVLTVGAGLYWLLPRGDRTGRVASLAFLLISVYFCYVPLYPWYLPPAGLLALVVIGRAVQRPEAFARAGLPSAAETGNPARRWAPPAVLAGILAWQSFLLVAGVHAVRVQQSIVEDGVRTRVGQWLKDHVRPGQTVYVECLGYVGYFSQAHMLDWPGLASPEVLRVKGPQSRMHTLVPKLRPDFIVARPGESALMRGKPYFNEHYSLAHTFDAREELARQGDFYGRAYAYYDAVFEVYQKDPDPSP
jgi:hypothetical protein